MSLVGPDSAANNPSKNTGGSSPKPKPKPKPKAPKPKQSFASKIMGGIKSAGAQLKSDFKHSTGQEKYTGAALKDYEERSAASKKAMDDFLKQTSKDDGPSGIAALKNTTDAQAQADQYAENLRRYEEYMKSQQPKGPEVTPDMRRAALDVFESQRGAGQMPYYMAAAANSQAPDMSPAFQYAAQNYATLGGSQRLGPRPMEMMSVAERRQINDMAQAMADQEARTQPVPFRDIAVGGGGKGGPRTSPQIPPGLRDALRNPDFQPFTGGPRIAPQQGGGFNSMEELMEFQRQNPTANLMGEYQRLKALEAGSQQAAADDYQAGMDMVMRGGGKGGPRTGPQIPPGMVGLPRTPDYGGGMPRPPLPFASMLASRFGGFGGQ